MILKFCQKTLVKNRSLSEEKKNTPSANIRKVGAKKKKERVLVAESAYNSQNTQLGLIMSISLQMIKKMFRITKIV